MTNTKFRKRALLSSVAMLLVALVALGSATFAWFVANPEVTSDGLKMTTTASAGLAVASTSAKAQLNDAAFGNSTKFAVTGGSAISNLTTLTDGINLTPVSIDTSATASKTPSLATIDADSNAASAKKSGAFSTSSSYITFNNSNDPKVSGGLAYYEDLFVKTTTDTAGDTATVASVKVDIDQTNINDSVSSGIRVAIYSVKVGDGNSETVNFVGAWAPSTAKNAANTAVGNFDASTHVASNLTCWDSSKSDGTTKNAAYILAGNSATISGGFQVTNSKTDNYFRVFVYLDGEDGNVYSSNVTTLKNLCNSITVTLTKAAS